MKSATVPARAGVTTFCKVNNLDKVGYVMQVGKHFDRGEELLFSKLECLLVERYTGNKKRLAGSEHDAIQVQGALPTSDSSAMYM